MGLYFADIFLFIIIIIMFVGLNVVETRRPTCVQIKQKRPFRPTTFYLRLYDLKTSSNNSSSGGAPNQKYKNIR
jgi:hypothetical protein